MLVSSEAIWGAVLDEMELDLGAIEAALRGEAPFPGAYRTRRPAIPLPPELAERARTLNLRQEVAVAELRRRCEALGSFIDGAPPVSQRERTAVAVDVRV